MNALRRLLLLLLGLLLLSACAAPQTPTPEATMVPSEPARPSPSATPSPQASETPQPPKPTQTPWPTRTATQPTATRAATVEPEWILDWADEFDVDGAPNPEIWDYEVGLVRNREAQYYTRDRRENVRVEGGYLVIEAHKEDFEGSSYTSGSIQTHGRKEILYGRVEVRAKVAPGRGTWPAIWLLGSNIDQVGWPKCGEVDIMEYVGYMPDRLFSAIHVQAFNGAKGNGKGFTLELENAAAEFHVFALNWYPDRMDFFVDGQRTLTFWNLGTGKDVWPFDEAQYLILNLAIGGAWGGTEGIDDTIFPVQYLVDYVRVYKAAQ